MKKRESIIVLALTMLIFLNSCALFQGGGMTHRSFDKATGVTRISQFEKGGTLTWAHHDATKRQSLMFVDSQGNVKVLAEQSPDAGISKITELLAKGQKDSISAELNLSFQNTLEKLTDRTPSLMITRESLYTLRELHFNGALDSVGVKDLYEKYLDKLVEIVKEDSKTVEAKAKVLMLEIEKEKLLAAKNKMEQPKNNKEGSKGPGTTKEKQDKEASDSINKK
ncbi:hypothetical protein HME9304_01827 [Flagellimonas maritima]|uniref:Uncharacterized protein n=1 Tax=Flagellimonas maritima TaxID=1383885 RepID=A0A2Z4LSX0_9FLAO|nr:hypothetical protein [Allomuricauda aurantiaca]AWX44822.1 hypothetical protein HME9304_01827 [Allomuricauda aurantiaca]